MTAFRRVQNLQLGALAMVLGSICGVGASGQASSEVTPRVQALYAEAKAAQQAGDEPGGGCQIRGYSEGCTASCARLQQSWGAVFRPGQYAAAARTLERALALDRKMTTASGVLGMSYLKLGRNNEAKTRLQAAVTAHPSDSTLHSLHFA
ncbi:MAG: hypothetical protein NVS9B15_06010 [Acidobacteriaceae bacterium]